MSHNSQIHSKLLSFFKIIPYICFIGKGSLKIYLLTSKKNYTMKQYKKIAQFFNPAMHTNMIPSIAIIVVLVLLILIGLAICP